MIGHLLPFCKEQTTTSAKASKVLLHYVDLVRIYPFQTSVAFHIETSRLFCRAKQMIGFYMKRNTELKRVKNYFVI